MSTKTTLTARTAARNPIQPHHLDVSRGIWNTIWQNTETEASARVLVRFAQKRGGWLPFAKAELDRFGRHDVRFNRLREGFDTEVLDNEANQWIQLDASGTYRYTVEFIAEVYAKAPAKLTEEVAS
jgi:hypothetical protein